MIGREPSDNLALKGEMKAQQQPFRESGGTREASMQDDVQGNHQIRAQLLQAAISYLHHRWPDAATLMPSTLGSDFSPYNRLFVEIVQDLIDDGMITVEFFVIGGAAEPVARGALLTRKGAENRGSM